MDKPLGGDRTATARAHSNIALIKYWGKRDAALNIPAVGSISLTLDALSTDTTVTFRPGLEQDEFWLAGTRADATRASHLLDIVRDSSGVGSRAVVESTNNFPTAAGLASSASGFAALAVAASSAAGLSLKDRELSILARRGSGSAARSLFGGIVELHAGTRADGLDSFAEPVLAAAAWPLTVVIAITELGQKSVNSTTGMGGSALTSPFYPAWVDTGNDDVAAMRLAIANREFQQLGELAEYSCLKLHGLMMSTRPALLYWNAATMAAIHAVRELRANGIPVYFTIDAGPQVKALCPPEHARTVADALGQVAGVHETRISTLGRGAQLLS
ncbi:diphosphomevalonate decarboxylase [Rhodoglobus vestalii]|uniref:diphosphomevalonate decarboxylase n=1 Tax=Rhodoglobus vestalii TaxID=193384 RepID=A0A8H2K615_9MICO|nr:diphosphomevalonate decarboxylase [Rhodoglobus vestalii]TQO19574.1 diphosphomevalonate decarboxylase [Rhodoglobus vestalii]